MNLRSFKLNRVYLDPLNMLMQETFPEDEFFYSSSKRGRKIRRRMSTSSIKRKFRRLHVVVVDVNENVLKSVMHVQSCCFELVVVVFVCLE